VYIEKPWRPEIQLSPCQAVQFSQPMPLLLMISYGCKQDAIVAGNFYLNNIQLGRYDANYGTILLVNGKGGFQALPAKETGSFNRKS